MADIQGQRITELTQSSSPVAGDKILIDSAASGARGIDYNQLADAILNRLTSKTYSLDAGTKTLIAALNDLNSNVSGKAYSTLSVLYTDLISKLGGNQSTFCSVSGAAVADMTGSATSAACRAYIMKADNATLDYILYLAGGMVVCTGRISSESTISSIHKLPTRAEMDTVIKRGDYKNIVDSTSDTHDTQPGSYWAARAASIPDGHQYGFLTHEVSGADPQERILTFYPYNAPGIFYKAVSNNAGSTWTAWYKYTGVQVS